MRTVKQSAYDTIVFSVIDDDLPPSHAVAELCLKTPLSISATVHMLLKHSVVSVQKEVET